MNLSCQSCIYDDLYYIFCIHYTNHVFDYLYYTLHYCSQYLSLIDYIYTITNWLACFLDHGMSNVVVLKINVTILYTYSIHHHSQWYASFKVPLLFSLFLYKYIRDGGVTLLVVSGHIFFLFAQAIKGSE